MQQILNFFENKKNIFKSDQIFSVEESFFFPVHEKNLLITGRYDLIVKKKNDIQIIDFKTGDEEVGDYKIQLSFYKFCFQKKYNYIYEYQFPSEII